MHTGCPGQNESAPKIRLLANAADPTCQLRARCRDGTSRLRSIHVVTPRLLVTHLGSPEMGRDPSSKQHIALESCMPSERQMGWSPGGTGDVRSAATTREYQRALIAGSALTVRARKAIGRCRYECLAAALLRSLFWLRVRRSRSA